jgi:hypothetical protein
MALHYVTEVHDPGLIKTGAIFIPRVEGGKRRACPVMGLNREPKNKSLAHSSKILAGAHGHAQGHSHGVV